MVTADIFRQLALALAEVAEVPHFERRAFRTPRRIFATLAGDRLSANIRLEPMQQEALTKTRPKAFQRPDKAWGAQGWTVVTLAAVDAAELAAVLRDAHALVSGPAPRAQRRGRSRPK